MMRILFFFVFLSSVAFGQDNDITNNRESKNMLIVNIGSTVFFFHDIGIKYQRLFFHEKINSSLTIGEDFLYADFFNRDNYFITSLKYGIITKPKKRNNPHHFEINTGIGFVHNKVISRNGISFSYGGPSETSEPVDELVNKRNYFSLIGNLGYLYQSQESSTVFRFGVGFPELLHIGLGVSF